MQILLLAKSVRDRVLRARSEGASQGARADVIEAKRRARRARAEADEVRAMAAAHARRDPGFANELYAAAQRHEQLAMEQQAA